MMDNATFHKKQSIQQVIIDAGHMVEYLPTYLKSPSYSGIASVTLKSSNIAVDDIIVYAKYRVPPLKPANKKVNFVGDVKTAKVGKIILNDADNNKIADGKNGFEFSTQLVDHNGNPVKQAGLVIKLRQEKGTIVSLPASSETDSDGGGDYYA
ncbi:hypothetical protein ARSQ2_02480 [Arsenophonus endosymbiont of Bemisia tabaci Q2]|nr:hypothetical protein ARSQ2_02480 [Arsenophonus endosymbiont of Bemisia tabaci Q2]